MGIIAKSQDLSTGNFEFAQVAGFCCHPWLFSHPEPGFAREPRRVDNEKHQISREGRESMQNTRILGQLLAAGFDGPEIPESFAALVRRYQVGNVILFKRNIRSFSQTKALCRSLHDLILSETGYPPIIMSGEEGGSVSRIGTIGVATPCPMAVGATGNPENARRLGQIVGEQLLACGIQMGLGPVLDVNCNPDNPVIGNRSYGTDPATVTAFGIAYLQGLQSTGILACAKHFPGHGDTAVDSHLALPCINKPEAELRKTELAPFAAAVRAGVQAVMTAHIVVPSLDPEGVPATVSRPVLTQLLRKEMGFQGLILSDGMEMRAVLDLYGIEEACRLALNAGCDMALVCHCVEQAASTMRYLSNALDRGSLLAEDICDRFHRVTEVKKRLPDPDAAEAAALGSEKQRADARRIMRESIRILNRPEQHPLPCLGSRTLFLGLDAIPASIASDAVSLNAARRFAELVNGQYTDGSDIPDQPWENAVVFLSPHPGLPRLLAFAQSLIRRNLPLIAVSLTLPECLNVLPDSVWKIQAWEYDELSVSCLRELLLNESGAGKRSTLAMI